MSLYELVSPSLLKDKNKVSYSEAKFSAMFTLKYTELKSKDVGKFIHPAWESNLLGRQSGTGTGKSDCSSDCNMGVQEKIAELQLEMARTQKNKATEVRLSVSPG